MSRKADKTGTSLRRDKNQARLWHSSFKTQNKIQDNQELETRNIGYQVLNNNGPLSTLHLFSCAFYFTSYWYIV